MQQMSTEHSFNSSKVHTSTGKSNAATNNQRHTHTHRDSGNDADCRYTAADNSGGGDDDDERSRLW